MQIGKDLGMKDLGDYEPKLRAAEAIAAARPAEAAAEKNVDEDVYSTQQMSSKSTAAAGSQNQNGGSRREPSNSTSKEPYQMKQVAPDQGLINYASNIGVFSCLPSFKCSQIPM